MSRQQLPQRDVARRDGTHLLEHLDGLQAHELPHEAEHQLLVAAGDVDAARAGHGEPELAAQLHGVVAVLHLLEAVQLGAVAVDALLVHQARVHLGDGVDEHEAVVQVVEQVGHLLLAHAQRVQPVAEDALLAHVLRVLGVLLEACRWDGRDGSGREREREKR